MTTKSYILFFLGLFYSSVCAQDWLSLSSNSPNSILSVSDGSRAISSSRTDSLEFSISHEMHGVFIEVLGKDGLYSVGYEYCKFRNKHAFGIGVGTSFWRPKVYGTIPYNQFSLSAFSFYEYGKIWGLRAAINISSKVNTIMFASRLDDVIPADKPSYAILSPAVSCSVFYKPKQSRFQFILNLYGTYSFARIEEPNGDLWRDYNENYFWIGLTVKYNLKQSDI